MNEPPEPGTPDARRIVAAYAREECTARWDGTPNAFCHGNARRRRWVEDIDSIERWGGRSEDV